MRIHLGNAFYGVVDYATWPIAMLVVAPLAVRNLGLERYGIWMVANSAISIGAIVASGFADAGIRYIATQRAAGNHDEVCRAVRSSLAIHLALGSLLAIAGWVLAPAMTARLLSADSGLRGECLWSLRIACLLLLVRALESVCISTQRAFERYGAAIRISIAGRVLSLTAAAFLPLLWPSVAILLAVMGAISALCMRLQLAELRTRLNLFPLTPHFHSHTAAALFGFGKFTWIQAISALLLGQIDRLITGAALGAAAVSSYSMCVQLSQPLYGITAAGLHFMFPRISAQSARQDETSVRRTIQFAVALNWAVVAFGAGILLFFGPILLRSWGGDAIARSSGPVLPIVVCSTAVSAMGIAGAYASMAIGQVRLVTWLNLAGAGAMLAAIEYLLPRYGIRGMGLARMVYGPITLAVYFPIFKRYFCGTTGRRTMEPTADTSTGLYEEG